MKLRIFLQRSEYNFQRYEYCKNKAKISPPSQNSMSFPGIDYEVLYIIVSINLHIGNDMGRVHYVCDVLYYNTGTWWNCDDTKITKYSVYPKNEYDNLSNDKKTTKREYVIQNGSDRIVSMLYNKQEIIPSRTDAFIAQKLVSKDTEHIKEGIAYFKAFKEELGRIKMICNKIQTSISLLKEDLETVTENNDKKVQVKNSYYWLSYDELKKISQ